MVVDYVGLVVLMLVGVFTFCVCVVVGCFGFWLCCFCSLCFIVDIVFG